MGASAPAHKYGDGRCGVARLHLAARTALLCLPVVALLTVTVPAVATAPATAPSQASATTQDGDPPLALLVVLDASGSMNEDVEGGLKRELAARGLLQLLADLPAGSVSGLRLLGEGDETDECRATKQLLPFAPFAPERWNAALGSVRWEGATPLGQTLREALLDLREIAAARKEILLIGDGEETCGEDPVGLARELAAGVRVNTMSLGKRVSHQLAGIALVTGGTYTQVFDDETFAAGARELPGVGRPVEPAADPGPATLHVILDLSNSMWGQIQGRAKIELAREALGATLTDLPDDVRVGLRAYGHRAELADRAASCRDTELLVAPTAGGGAEVIARAAELSPRGQTPIALSLREGAADIVATPGGVLLLISDGLESCDGDPMAVAAELRAAGSDVRLHTVGLGVNAEEAASLAGLAAAGGGDYFDAPSAEALMSSVDVAVRTAGEPTIQQADETTFPASIARVRGGDDVGSAEVLPLGDYSFTEHLFRDQRYFAIAGAPGAEYTLAGLVCALAIGRTRNGTVTFQGTPSMLVVERIDAAGERLRGRNLVVRGEMGEWREMVLTVGDDGLARFRIGRPQGNVHRDMVFRISAR